MNKKVINIFIILMTLLLVNPLKVNATSINSATMEGETVKTVGDTLYISFRINFNDLKMATLDTEGIYMTGVEFSFDESVLTLTEITSQHFDSTVYKDKETNRYAIISIVNSSNDISNRCNDQFLYCADYYVTLKFFVNNTTQETTSISTYEYAAGVFKVNNEGTYNIDDMKELSLPKSETKNIKINQPPTAVTDNKTSIVENSKPTITNTITTSKNTNEEEKSSNKYLKTLTIKNYELNFKKDKYTYKLTLPKDINELYITAETEDPNAKYIITGADNLQENNDKVRIIVTAEDGDKVTYSILVDRKKEAKENIESTDKVMSKLNRIVLIVLTAIIVIVIISIIVSIHNKRKIKKLLDEI